MDWISRIHSIERELTPLYYDEDGTKLAKLVELETELRRDKSIEGILALPNLGKAFEQLHSAKAERLHLDALDLIRQKNNLVRTISMLITVGCYYSRDERLDKAEHFFSEAFLLIEKLEARRHFTLSFWIQKVLLFFKINNLARSPDARDNFIKLELRECRAFYYKCGNKAQVDKIERLLEAEPE